MKPKTILIGVAVIAVIVVIYLLQNNSITTIGTPTVISGSGFAGTKK